MIISEQPPSYDDAIATHVPLLRETTRNEFNGQTACPASMYVIKFDIKPQTAVCSACRLTVRTVVKSRSTFCTHITACTLCILGCWPCACMIYCCDAIKNIDHYCPNCTQYLGSNTPQ